MPTTVIDILFNKYPVCPAADYAVVGSNGPQLMFSSLPPLLSTITKLDELHLSSHQLLNSSLPAELAALQQLRVLHLAGPGVQGGVVLPAAWGQLQKLESLWLLNLGGGVAGEGGNTCYFLDLHITCMGMKVTLMCMALCCCLAQQAICLILCWMCFSESVEGRLPESWGNFSKPLTACCMLHPGCMWR